MSAASFAERPNVAQRRSGLRAFEESRAFSTTLLLPILIFFVILNVIPTLWMIGFSFYRYSLQSPSAPRLAFSVTERGIWTQLPFDNFVKIYNDAAMWGAFGRTFWFVLLAVVIQVILGVALGFLFWGSAKMPGRRIALTMLFTPMVITPVASGLFWKLIYEPTFGVINYIITAFGGQKIDFLTNNNWAFPAVLFVDVWMWTPFMILMTLAALGSVPKAELEAAEVDRMGVLKRLWYVILPHGKFILMLGILLRTIDAFKTTDLVFLMTNGGPGNVTELIGLQLYRFAFASLNIGFSSALALVLLMMAIAFTSAYLWVLNLRRRSESAH
jgi:multiple sugar transport system permease protein